MDHNIVQTLRLSHQRLSHEVNERHAAFIRQFTDESHCPFTRFFFGSYMRPDPGPDGIEDFRRSRGDEFWQLRRRIEVVIIVSDTMELAKALGIPRSIITAITATTTASNDVVVMTDMVAESEAFCTDGTRRVETTRPTLVCRVSTRPDFTTHGGSYPLFALCELALVASKDE